MKDISLYGAGGHCFAAIELIRSLDKYRPTVIYDDNPQYESILNVPVKNYTAEDLLSDSMCITIGNNANRKKIAKEFDVIFSAFQHPSAVIYPSATIGIGTLIHPNAVLDAESIIGNFCIVNNNATVSHNVIASDFVHIAINVTIAGGVKIGEGTLLRAGSVVLPEVTIGKWVTIGAGAVITKDVPDFAIIFGNPSKIVNYNSNK